MGKPQRCGEVSAEFYLSSLASFPTLTLSSWRRGWGQMGLNFQPTKKILCWWNYCLSDGFVCFRSQLHTHTMLVPWRCFTNSLRHLWLSDQWLHIAAFNLYDFCPGLGLALTNGYEYEPCDNNWWLIYQRNKIETKLLGMMRHIWEKTGKYTLSEHLY